MAVFKCKMCGGTLEVNNETVAVCQYCGTKQTLPKLDDDRKANLYDRANHFRRNNEFDKAMGIYNISPLNIICVLDICICILEHITKFFSIKAASSLSFKIVRKASKSTNGYFFITNDAL